MPFYLAYVVVQVEFLTYNFEVILYGGVMESYEVFKDIFKEHKATALAEEIGVSKSLIYKWGESHQESGAHNPIDRLIKLGQATGSVEPLKFLCHHFGGFYVENPFDLEGDCNEEAMVVIQTMLREFSELLNVISISINNDNRIDLMEAKEIRKEWNDLKSYTERFVQACEAGVFDK